MRTPIRPLMVVLPSAFTSSFKSEETLAPARKAIYSMRMKTPTSPTRTLSTLAIMAVLSACSTLPRDGPTGRSIERAAATPSTAGDYAIVDLDYSVSEQIKALPPRFLGSLETGDFVSFGGTIGAGDKLAISIFEPSGALFGSGASSNNAVRSGSQALPLIAVDAAGAVSIPFAGLVRVGGMSPTDAAGAIRRALIGKVGNPQVVVSIAENAFNTVVVLGEVKQPGRAALSTNSDRVLDVIADRGGIARAPEDLQIVINRGGETFVAPMSFVMSEFVENIRLARGDQINLVYVPRRYSTFGALGTVSQTDMGSGPVTLAGALSKVGGLDTNTANARAVFVFRFERSEVARTLGVTQSALPRGVPIIYRLDLENPAGFFAADNFLIEPNDIVYVPRSGSAELSKFFALVQTFTRVIYDVSVTGTLSN